MIKNISSRLTRPRLFTICFSSLAIMLMPSQRVHGEENTQQRALYDIAEAISPERIEQDITTLVNFGTRHTLSQTESDTRGIGAARRWIKAEFEKISAGAFCPFGYLFGAYF